MSENDTLSAPYSAGIRAAVNKSLDHSQRSALSLVWFPAPRSIRESSNTTHDSSVFCRCIANTKNHVGILALRFEIGSHQHLRQHPLQHHEDTKNSKKTRHERQG